MGVGFSFSHQKVLLRDIFVWPPNEKNPLQRRFGTTTKNITLKIFGFFNVLWYFRLWIWILNSTVLVYFVIDWMFEIWDLFKDLSSNIMGKKKRYIYISMIFFLDNDLSGFVTVLNITYLYCPFPNILPSTRAFHWFF